MPLTAPLALLSMIDALDIAPIRPPTLLPPVALTAPEAVLLTTLPELVW